MKAKKKSTPAKPMGAPAATNIDPARHPLTAALMQGRSVGHKPFIGAFLSTTGEGFGVMVGTASEVDGWHSVELPIAKIENGPGRIRHWEVLQCCRVQDMHAAQMKLLREHHPRLFAALDMKAEWRTSGMARADMMEAWLRAYAADMMQLFKGWLFTAAIPTDIAFIRMLSDAADRATPFDVVDAELAAGWEPRGYSGMKPREYAAIINGKLGTRITPGAMKWRAQQKLGLTGRRAGGRPENENTLPRNW